MYVGLYEWREGDPLSTVFAITSQKMQSHRCNLLKSDDHTSQQSTISLITSRVSCWGNVFYPVCPSFRLSICLWTLSQHNRYLNGFSAKTIGKVCDTTVTFTSAHNEIGSSGSWEKLGNPRKLGKFDTCTSNTEQTLRRTDRLTDATKRIISLLR